MGKGKGKNHKRRQKPRQKQQQQATKNNASPPPSKSSPTPPRAPAPAPAPSQSSSATPPTPIPIGVDAFVRDRVMPKLRGCMKALVLAKNTRCGARATAAQQLPVEVSRNIFQYLRRVPSESVGTLLCRHKFYTDNGYNADYELDFEADGTCRVREEWVVFTSGSGDNEPGGGSCQPGKWSLTNEYNVRMTFADPKLKVAPVWNLCVDQNNPDLLGLYWHYDYINKLVWQHKSVWDPVNQTSPWGPHF
ncbi:hypothetical protein Pelo_3105 [Pelomyxa schiedti]|nr:hypothetical protein Pelo_3105 [Pelomyxa schiedti]